MNGIEQGISMMPTSVGFEGTDFNRSFGRAYDNVSVRIDSIDTMQKEYADFTRSALSLGRRRSVFRATVSEQVADHLQNTDQFPLEVSLPLSLIEDTTDHIIMLGDDIRSVEVPEWPSVYGYWRAPASYMVSLDHAIRAVDHGSTQFSLTRETKSSDTQDLFTLWKPFGWTMDQITAYVNSGQDSTSWFSGVRERTSGKLVAASMGEQLLLAGRPIVEMTEWSTAPGYEQHGFCAASVSGLVTQILDATLYRGNRLPLILAELNMTSRSDFVARSIGMTIPGVEGVHGLDHTPRQVLRHNVAVYDRHAPNSRSFQMLQESEQRWFRDAYKMPYRYLRNFIVGILPKISIDMIYPKERVQTVLSLYQ